MPASPSPSSVILGATGATGKHLARELLNHGHRVRVASRSEQHLQQAFSGLNVEHCEADMLDLDAVRRAIDSCTHAFDCIGVPMDRFDDHPRTATNIATAAAGTNIRLIHVTSYWSYLPVTQLPLTEDHPRTGGTVPIQRRREAEDILCSAGAAVVNLPDFYGPESGISFLQNAILEARAGKTVNWIGSTSGVREHIYVPDAAAIIARLIEHDEAYGKHWIAPGPGPITITEICRILEKQLNQPVKFRVAGGFILRILSLLSKQIREIMPIVPYYLHDITFDASRLGKLIGPSDLTSYTDGIAKTLDWLASK